MNTLCETKGFRAGTVRIPAFALNRGEWLVLCWPTNFGSDSENRFYDALSGSALCPDLALRATAKIVAQFGRWAEPLYRHRTLAELLGALSAEDRSRLSGEIEFQRLAPSAPLDHLPGTSRVLAGLMLASSSGEILVFNTAGLDPTGVQRVYAYLADKMKLGISCIELEFPDTAQRQAHPVGVTVLEASQ
jgi:hypothetical protein